MHVSKGRATAALAAVATLVSLAFAVGASGRHENNRHFDARLDGYQEVPSISTRGNGTFRARVSQDRIAYTLKYSSLESTAQQAHIHFAQRHVNGAVVAFLCGGGTKPACPPSGTVKGEIVATDILAVPTQGIAAGELAEVIRAMRSRSTYVNVHTSTFGSGEIRGQVTLDQTHGHGNASDKDKDNNDDD